MSVIDWFINFFGKKQVDGTITIDLSDSYCGSLTSNMIYKQLAIETAINLVAAAFVRAEFKTYIDKKEEKKESYFLFNYEPSENFSAAAFWKKLIRKLYYNEHVIVIQNNNKFYIADSFTQNINTFSENTYTDVVIDNRKINKVFLESEIFYFRLQNGNARNLIESINTDYSNLIAYSQKTYKTNNTKRGTLTIPTNYPQTEKPQADLKDLMQNRLKAFYEAENGGVLPLTNGITYQELGEGSYKGGSDSRDIRNLIDDIFDMVAIAFNVPVQLLKGTLNESDKVIDRFVIFCVNPLKELLQDEINRKLYKKKVLEGTFLEIDTSFIHVAGIKDLATTIDLLFRTGTQTINENRQMVNKQPVDKPFANNHYVTKNYSDIEKMEEGESASK